MYLHLLSLELLFLSILEVKQSHHRREVFRLDSLVYRAKVVLVLGDSGAKPAFFGLTPAKKEEEDVVG